MSLETTQMSISALDLDLLEATIELLFLTACADGLVDDAERAAFEKLVSEATRGEVKPATLRRILSHLERRPLPEQRGGRLRQIAKRLFDPRLRRGVLSLAREIAVADGKLTDDERTVLEEAATAFEIPAEELSALLA